MNENQLVFLIILIIIMNPLVKVVETLGETLAKKLFGDK